MGAMIRWAPAGAPAWPAVVCLLATIGALALVTAAEAQVRIVGRTMSDTSAPVAGAEILLRTQASDAVVARATSDAAGAFLIEVATAGAYRVSVERQGYYAIEHQLETLAAGTELLLTLLPVREHLESLDVTSRGDPSSLGQPSTEQALSGAEAMNVPFNGSHGVKNALRTLPGVVMDGGGGIHVDGARESQTLFILDGFNVSDPLHGGFDPKVSVEAVQALTVRSGVYAAEYGKGSGGVIEVATHVGGDRLRYSATDFFPTIVREKGLRIQDWTPRLSVSGPLARRRAWFSDSFIGEYDQFFVEELPVGQDSSTSRRMSNLLRAQVNVTSKHVLQLSAVGSTGVGRRLGLGPLDPVSTTRDARSHQWFANVRDQFVFASGAVFEAGYGANRTVLRLTPRGHDPFISSPSGRSGNYYYDGRQDAIRDQIVANVYAPPVTWFGSHQIKAGTDLNRVAFRQDAMRGHIELYDKDDQLIRSIAYLGSGQLEKVAGEVAAFVQDAWTVHPRLAVHAGVRVDWDSLTRDTTLSPRLMTAWTPTDGLKLSAGFAVTHDAARLQPFAAALDQSPVSIYAPPYGPGSLVLSRFVVGESLDSPVAHVDGDARSPAAGRHPPAPAGPQPARPQRPRLLRDAERRHRRHLHAREPADRVVRQRRDPPAAKLRTGVRLAGRLHAIVAALERRARQHPRQLLRRRGQQRATVVGHTAPRGHLGLPADLPQAVVGVVPDRVPHRVPLLGRRQRGLRRRRRQLPPLPRLLRRHARPGTAHLPVRSGLGAAREHEQPDRPPEPDQRERHRRIARLRDVLRQPGPLDHRPRPLAGPAPETVT
jgi:hypothetical protein